MSTVIYIPTWATFNRIPTNAPHEKLAALNALLTSAGIITEDLVAGSFNPVWFDLQDLDLGGGPLVRGANPEDLAEVTPITNASFLTLQHVALALTIGGDVLGFPAGFFVIPDPTAEVPAYLPDRDPEAEPATTTHTWQSWYQSGNPNDYPIQIDGIWYGAIENYHQTDSRMLASQWYPWLLTGGQIVQSLPTDQGPME